MGNQKKRLDKLSADLLPKERSIAILDAVRKDDIKTAIALQETTPTMSYSGPDGAVSHTIDAVENMSLRFDRAFYASALILQTAEEIGGKQAEELITRIEKDMYAKISGLDLFAERVGLSVDRLLAFSTALNGNFVQPFRRDLDNLSKEEMELAQQACSEMEFLWENRSGHSVFTVAE
tara:strand:- start:7 stop:540 length:534 start_codon:yes stop_codon:yes gene_type:complete